MRLHAGTSRVILFTLVQPGCSGVRVPSPRRRSWDATGSGGDADAEAHAGLLDVCAAVADPTVTAPASPWQRYDDDADALAHEPFSGFAWLGRRGGGGAWMV